MSVTQTQQRRYDSRTKIHPLTPCLCLKSHRFQKTNSKKSHDFRLENPCSSKKLLPPKAFRPVLRSCPQVYRELIDAKGQPSHRGTILALKLKASRTDRGPSLHDGFQIAHYAGVDDQEMMVFVGVSTTVNGIEKPLINYIYDHQ